MGGLDGLVNSAGACAYTREWGKGMFEQTEEDWDRVMDTNAKAPFFLSRAVLSHMIEHQARGNILNVVSKAAFVPASASYGASKHALRALTAGLASAAIRYSTASPPAPRPRILWTSRPKLPCTVSPSAAWVRWRKWRSWRRS